MRASMKVMLLVAVFLLSTSSVGQECEALKTSSLEKLTEYLQHAGDSAEVAPCVQVAFHRMQRCCRRSKQFLFLSPTSAKQTST